MCPFNGIEASRLSYPTGILTQLLVEHIPLLYSSRPVSKPVAKYSNIDKVDKPRREEGSGKVDNVLCSSKTLFEELLAFFRHILGSI